MVGTAGSMKRTAKPTGRAEEDIVEARNAQETGPSHSRRSEPDPYSVQPSRYV